MYIVGYTVGNLIYVLNRKRDFRTYENFEYSYPNSNALLQSRLKLERRNKAHVVQKCDLINDVKLFPTVHRNFLTLSNKTSRYKIKCIRMSHDCQQNHFSLTETSCNNFVQTLMVDRAC